MEYKFLLRENLLVRYLTDYSPDLICLQECKPRLKKCHLQALKSFGLRTTLQEVKRLQRRSNSFQITYQS